MLHQIGKRKHLEKRKLLDKNINEFDTNNSNLCRRGTFLQSIEMYFEELEARWEWFLE